MQDTLREKDHTLSERQRVLEENRVALERLNTEKDDLAERHRQLTERQQHLQRQYTQLDLDHRELQGTLREIEEAFQTSKGENRAKEDTLRQLNGEKVLLVEERDQTLEQIRSLQEQYDQLDVLHAGLQDTLYRKDVTLLAKEQTLEENRIALERLNTEKVDLAEQHRQLTEQERNLRGQHNLLTRQHTQLGLDHRGLQGTLREKDHILSERQRVLDENRVALGTLSTEKTDLTEQYRQSVLAAKTLENNIALLEKQNAASEVQLRILQEKSLSQSPEVKEKVTVVSSHEASTPLSIKSSFGTSVYKTDSSSEKTLVLSLENQKTDPLHLVTPQVIVEGNIAEQAMEARRVLSSQYSKKYAQLASQQTKAEIAQTESMEQLKIEEEKANLAFEKNKRAETDRQLLEMQIESKRNRN